MSAPSHENISEKLFDLHEKDTTNQKIMMGSALSLVATGLVGLADLTPVLGQLPSSNLDLANVASLLALGGFGWSAHRYQKDDPSKIADEMVALAEQNTTPRGQKMLPEIQEKQKDIHAMSQLSGDYYKKFATLSGAGVGLIIGSLFVTATPAVLASIAVVSMGLIVTGNYQLAKSQGLKKISKERLNEIRAETLSGQTPSEDLSTVVLPASTRRSLKY